MRILLYILLIFFSISCKEKSDTPINIKTTEEKNVTSENIFEEISVEKAKELLSAQPEIMLLDVRAPEETKEGVLKNTRIINFYDPDFTSKLDSLDKSKTYIVYCAVGGRSKSAGQIMVDKGFTKVYNLSGGYQAWNQ